MRIVLVTPLYPPDTASTALYVKELARRLSSAHEVTIVAYAHIPEPVKNVEIVAVPKRQPLTSRLSAFIKVLRQASQNSDVVYAINGASVELPLLFVDTPFVFALNDTKAHARAERSFLLGTLERAVSARAQSIVRDFPIERPEILPLEEAPSEEEYEKTWNTHLTLLNETFAHAT